MKTYFNYIYEYSTPFGILKNNLPKEKMSKIFKESLTSYNKEYYDTKYLPIFKDFVNNKLNNRDEVNYFHFHDLSSQSSDHLNLYFIQDTENTTFYINHRFIQRMKQTASYYFIFDVENENELENTINYIKKFKSKFRITHLNVVLLSPFEIETTECKNYKIDIKNISTKEFFSFLKKELSHNFTNNRNAI